MNNDGNDGGAVASDGVNFATEKESTKNTSPTNNGGNSTSNATAGDQSLFAKSASWYMNGMGGASQPADKDLTFGRVDNHGSVFGNTNQALTKKRWRAARLQLGHCR